MGCHGNISASRFPKQGNWVGKFVDVCFNYNTSVTVVGRVVRDDREDPHVCIIALDDGRYVLATECQHSMPRAQRKAGA